MRSVHIGRRDLIARAALLALAGCARPTAAAAAGPLAAIRERTGGRLGVAALDTGSGKRIALDADGRYAMCSTFKLPLAAAVLREVERGALSLDTPIRFGADDLVPYAPVIEANLAAGTLTVAELCAAAVTVSDNVAANLLLRLIGGPAAMTAFFRDAGDAASRLDRWEPDLNANLPGDPRDTTTPAAMLVTAERLLLGDMLSPGSRARLADWMTACRTGLNRLRAGFPPEWRAGDKTGTSGNGAANDVAIAWPPNRAPILIACYVDSPDASPEQRDRTHADVARAVVRAFA
ncbi:class A beta-lactamase [Sphingosinithalassobacter sp. LHW66-3]|uniref:class A beta-lactamase n=1 Tax=Sphingosinithalassobacter sp. LHW66-3 TaxID=3424718 RepID=UPI003D6C5528